MTHPSKDRYQQYPEKTSVVFGALQIVFGVLTIFCQVGWIVIRGEPYAIVNLVCGVVYVTAGGLGIGAGRTHGGKCLVISTMVLSIIAAVLAGPSQCVWSLFDVLKDLDIYRSSETTGRQQMGLAVICFLIILGFFECVAAIVQSVLCCRGCCCGRTEGNTAVHFANKNGHQVKPLLVNSKSAPGAGVVSEENIQVQIH